jgi:cell division protein FtsI/penicillin-binding protein 2
MWDAIAKVLTNSNALLVLIFLVIFFLLFVLLARTGLVQIHTNSFRMGADTRERDIVRQQTEWAHIYVTGMRGTVDDLCKNVAGYDPYITMYILERMYSEVVEWITYNHINLDSDYISIKQDKIKALLASLTVKPEVFTSKQFYRKVDEWTEEIIHKLVKIREVYK